MKYKTFFADYCEDKHLEPENSPGATLDEILHSMDCVLHYPGNYFGFIDASDTTLQFMVNDDKTIHVDIPSPEKGGSYVKTSELKDCLTAVKAIDGKIDISMFEDLKFQSWG